MSKYFIYFNQQWVGDHPAEWYDTRGAKIAVACGWPQEVRKFK